MPRPSSPLSAKASVRSPYALDRSQQNSCVLTAAGVRTPAAHTCALYSSDNDVFSDPSSKLQGEPDEPFNSRCHRRRPAKARDGNSFAYDRCGSGGARRDRTDDLMLAKHALYQLSYGPQTLEAATAGSRHRSVVRPPEGHTMEECGGPRQTRTADLTLIRRVL